MSAEIFNTGDKIRWKQQALTSEQVGCLILKLTLGHLGPFTIQEVTEVPPNTGVGHTQVLKLTEMPGEMSGFWFEKAP